MDYPVHLLKGIEMERLFREEMGEFYLIYTRPEADENAVQVQGYFYPADQDDEIEFPEFTYYAEPSIKNALDQYVARMKRQMKEKVAN